MACSLDQSICCIVQAQSTISQSLANLITNNLIPTIAALPDAHEKTCLTTTLLNSNANYVCATAHLLKSVSYYKSVTHPPKLCQDSTSNTNASDSPLNSNGTETCFPTLANPYGRSATLSC